MFFWIIIGAVILWFFSMNLNEYVTIHLFYKTYPNINLIIIIFITFFIGTVIGAILLSPYVFTARSEIRLLRKEKSNLQKEVDGLRNMSIDDILDIAEDEGSLGEDQEK